MQDCTNSLLTKTQLANTECEVEVADEIVSDIVIYNVTFDSSNFEATTFENVKFIESKFLDSGFDNLRFVDSAFVKTDLSESVYNQIEFENVEFDKYTQEEWDISVKSFSKNNGIEIKEEAELLKGIDLEALRTAHHVKGEVCTKEAYQAKKCVYKINGEPCVEGEDGSGWTGYWSTYQDNCVIKVGEINIDAEQKGVNAEKPVLDQEAREEDNTSKDLEKDEDPFEFFEDSDVEGNDFDPDFDPFSDDDIEDTKEDSTTEITEDNNSNGASPDELVKVDVNSEEQNTEDDSAKDENDTEDKTVDLKLIPCTKPSYKAGHCVYPESRESCGASEDANWLGYGATYSENCVIDPEVSKDQMNDAELIEICKTGGISDYAGLYSGLCE